MKDKKERILYGVSAVIMLVSVVVLYITHRAVPFMMDDLWYSTMLSSKEPITSLGDIVESQIWHYHNWGGRSMTHGMLQMILLAGEGVADILNVLVTLLLAWMICVVAGKKNLPFFLAAFGMLFGLNANWKMSMFWQSGLVNYVYSTAWILLFLWPYLRAADEPEKKALAGVTFWIMPLGIMSGWSNENMGPSCFVLAMLVIGYRKLLQKKKIPLWMLLGALTSLVGSVLVVIAPGNFVRSSAIEKKCLLDTLIERVFSMFQAGMDFLFPVCVLLVVLLLIYCIHFREKLRPGEILLLVGMVLSYGAMVLSPHYPDRATFGTMVLGICLIVSLLEGILQKCPAIQKFTSPMTASVWGCSILCLIDIFIRY